MSERSSFESPPPHREAVAPPPLPPSAPTPAGGPPPVPPSGAAPPPIPLSEVGPAPVVAGSHEGDAPQRSFVCPTCGSQVFYVAGTTTVRCQSCGTVQQIAPERAIVEHSYDEWAALPPKPVGTIGAQVLVCTNCGARTETTDLAGVCGFCGGVLVADQNPAGLIPPEAVVPFHYDRAGANGAFVAWVKSRRFAPSALKKIGSTESIQGTYIPHWTYDSNTDTHYEGRRGDHYYVPVTRTVSDGRGGTRTETYMEQRTRWSHRSGEVARSFDDVVVPASHLLPPDKLATMGPWSLPAAQAFQPEYLAGFRAVRYDVDPNDGLAQARGQMEQVIENDCKADIGGDIQQVESMDVRYRNVMFKLMLLPLWIAAYVFGGKTYQVLVNANTGEVVGDRPYSWVKITAAIAVGVIVVVGIILAIVLSRR